LAFCPAPAPWTGTALYFIFFQNRTCFKALVPTLSRRRKTRFKRNFIHEVDETFAMAELGSVVVSFGDLLDAANFGAKRLHLVNHNVQQRNTRWLMWEDFSSARFWCLFLSSSLEPFCQRHKPFCPVYTLFCPPHL
jgi:hypothetical protein